MKKFNAKGFSTIEVAILVVVIGVIGGIGWYIGQRSAAPVKTNAKQNSSTKETVATQKDSTLPVESFALASDKVTFNTPKGWSTDGVGCIKDSAAYSGTQYLDSIALLPGEKLRTVYGDGTDSFHINVCVVGNPNKLSPEDWFNGKAGGLGAGGGGHPSERDISSKDNINGNSAYYIKFVVSEHDYDELNYVISAKDIIVHVNARTYETDKNLPGVGDFRKFEPAIKDLVQSLQIK